MASKKRNQQQRHTKKQKTTGGQPSVVKEKLKQKYVKRIMGKIRGYYNKIQLLSAVHTRF